MTNILTNIALANAIFEEKQNYIDTYFPFILKTFDSEEIVSLKIISDQIIKIFDFELPIHSIKDILSRRESEIFQIKKNSKSDWNISLSKQGKTELNELKTTEANIEIKLHEFYKAFYEWKKTDPSSPYNLDEIRELVESFLKKNLIEISIKNGNNFENIHEINGFEKDVVLFLAYIKKNESSLVNTFEHLWKGTVIWNELTKDDQEKESLDFPKDLTVYVDTNFIFSLLGFHNPIINQAAIELHTLLIEVNNITLRVLDDTIFEIYHLLEFYSKVKDDFHEIEVDSIFFYLKKQGYSLAKTEKLKDELIDLLKEKFEIYFTETNILTPQKQKWHGTIHNHLLSIRTDINEKRRVKKSEYAIEKGVNHDASAITHILGQKNRHSTRLENSKAIFLTSSFWLFYNYKKIHREFESNSSVIFDATLTNILYLKNPKKGSQIAIDQIIKSHCNYLIVNNNIWARYINEAKELLASESIDIEDYSRLVSKNQYSEQLLLENNPDEINPTKVLKILNEIKAEDQLKEEKIKNLESKSKTKTVAITSKDIQIDDLTKRIKDLEKDKLKKEAEKRHEMNVLNYKSNMNTSMSENWNQYLKKLKTTRCRYSVFILFAFIVIFTTIFLKESISDKSITNYIDSGLLFWIIIALGIILFSIPFIRSFFNHEDVLNSFLLLFSKNKIKKEFETEFEKAYLRENKMPINNN